MRPEPIPLVAQDVIDALPPKLEGETDFGYENRLTPHQRGIYEWFQRDMRNGKHWQVYCAV